MSNLNDGTVTKLQASNGARLGTFEVGDAPYGIVFDGTYIWVSNSGDGTLSKLEPSDGHTLETIMVGPDPRHLRVSGTHLYIASNGGDTVEQLDLATATYEHNYGFIRFLEGVLFDGTNLWVTRLNGVSKFTPKAQ